MLIEAFCRNPVKVSVGVLLVALFGVIAMVTMPVQLTPEVDRPTITVETRWPGASPQEVEREIVQEQEEQLRAVEGVVKMTSESMDSRAQITLEFAVGTDMSQALLMVNTRLSQVPEYPQDADEPVISTSNLADRPIAWFVLGQRPPSQEEIAALGREHPHLREVLDRARGTENPGLLMFRLRRLALEHAEVAAIMPEPIDVPTLLRFAEDFIEARLERVPGVSNSNVLGGRQVEMQVIVDSQRLADRNLTIGHVRGALELRNLDVSGGDFWEGKRRYVVRSLGQYRSPEDVLGTVLWREGDATVYLRDVADVRLGYRKPDGVVRRFGTEALAINAARNTGANVIEVMEGLRDVAAELNEGILAREGLYLQQVYDETEYIYSSISLVQDNIVVGGALTVAVLLLFLRSGRSTLVIGLAIPTSIIGTFMMLALMGRSLNMISLAGLAFAVGMLVDNAIVVLENIYRHHQMGQSALRAAVRGTQEVWGAVVASTVTTLAVFIPVLFVEEEAGQLFRDIALAISSAVGLSLVVSVIVIPTAANRLLGGARRRGGTGETPVPLGDAATPPSPPFARGAAEDGRAAGAEEGESNGRKADGRLGGFTRRQGARFLGIADRAGSGFVDGVVAINAWLQRGRLRRIVLSIVFIGAAAALSYYLRPPVEYLPNGNRNLVIGFLLPPPGYSIEELTELGEEIEGALEPYWNVDPANAEGAERDAPAIGDFFYVARGRQLFMGLRSADPLRAAELIPLIQRVGSRIPGMIAVANQSSLFEQGLGAGRTVDVEIVGPELTRLVELGGRIMGQVSSVVNPDDPSSVQARPVPSLDLSSPEVHVVPRWEQAADMGIDATSLGYTVNALVDGAYASDYFFGGDKIDLVIIGQEQFASHTQDLESIAVATPTGQLVPLGAIADVRWSSGPEQINHRERQRAITIQVRPPETIALEDAVARIQEQIVQPMLDAGELAGGYQINFSGTADKLRETWDALWFNFLLAFLITYLLMAALFESWLYPLAIISSVVFGLVGGIIGLQLLNALILIPRGQFQQLDVLTMLGFVILVGTVVNNPILIVHQSLNHMRDDRMHPRDAILKSVRTRIRPIFMTTSTTVFGLLPLVLFPGAGSELYRGLGSVVLGGLVVSTIFTLLLVPTLFSLLMDAKEGVLRMLGRRQAGEQAETAEMAEARAPVGAA